MFWSTPASGWFVLRRSPAGSSTSTPVGVVAQLASSAGCEELEFCAVNENSLSGVAGEAQRLVIEDEATDYGWCNVFAQGRWNFTLSAAQRTVFMSPCPGRWEVTRLSADGAGACSKGSDHLVVAYGDLRQRGCARRGCVVGGTVAPIVRGRGNRDG
jgi:hypothetical protein